MWLVTSDLHLTDRPRDNHRFGIFEWLATQQQKHHVHCTFILGDVCDRKDNHSSNLVNRTIDELSLLRPPIHILMGNHDYIAHSSPFFRFLNCIEGLNFVSKLTTLGGLGVVLLPHQPDQAKLEASCKKIPPKQVVFTHNTFTGAESETGSRLTGLSASPIEDLQPRLWLSGDVHKPQTLDCGLTYVGSPYHVRFGDNFTPRCLLVEGGDMKKNLYFPCLRKWSLTIHGANDLFSADLNKGDQVKITLQLGREEVVEWAKHKRNILAACKELELEVFGIEMDVVGGSPERIKSDTKTTQPEDVFEEFCKSENVAANLKAVGKELLS